MTRSMRPTSPNPRDVGFPVSRRTMLAGLAGTAGVAGIAACSSGSSSGAAATSSAAAAATSAAGGSAPTSAAGAAPTSGAAAAGGGTAKGTITFGSNGSDAVPKAAYAAANAAFQTANPNAKVKTNTVDHDTFQTQINTYLQGTPDDVFTWFAGYRMRFFAAKGLTGDISDIWAKATGFSDGFKQASTGDDGKQYFVPIYNYPWAIFYRKSIWAKHGYEVPATFDALKTLATKMKADGLSPIGFADKDGWPAMGTFDIINMRTNGYQFHVDLMANKESWSDPKVTAVFNNWADLLPYHETGSLGRTWQEAAQNLGKGTSGMYLLGSFVGQQFTGAALDDLDFFPFPSIDTANGTDSIDAPIDGLMMAKKPKNEDGAKALLAYWLTPAAENTYLKTDSNDVAANKGATTTGYNALQKKASDLIASTKNIAQFMDRDTRPDFASTVMIPSLQSFIKNPKDVASLQKSIASQAKTIFATAG